MSITKTEIATVLNARLNRSETAASLSEQIRSVLWEISRLGNWADLFTSNTAALVDGTETITLPALFKALDEVIISNAGVYDATVTYSENHRVTYGGSTWRSLEDSNTGNTPAEGSWWTTATEVTDSEPLERITFKDYLREREGETSSSRSEPTKFARRGGSLYLYQVADEPLVATYYYFQYHPDQAAILFGEEFREAIYNGVMRAYLAGLGLQADPKFNQIAALYASEIAQLLPSADYDPAFVQYHDV